MLLACYCEICILSYYQHVMLVACYRHVISLLSLLLILQLHDASWTFTAVSLCDLRGLTLDQLSSVSFDHSGNLFLIKALITWTSHGGGVEGHLGESEQLTTHLTSLLHI